RVAQSFILFSVLFLTAYEMFLYSQSIVPKIDKLTIPAVVVAPNILPASNRPLDFVEIPITSDSPMDVRAGTSLYVLGQYLKLIFTSYPMRYYYGYAQIVPVSMGNPLALLSLALHALLLVLSFIFLNKNTLISF